MNENKIIFAITFLIKLSLNQWQIHIREQKNKQFIWDEYVIFIKNRFNMNKNIFQQKINDSWMHAKQRDIEKLFKYIVFLNQ